MSDLMKLHNRPISDTRYAHLGTLMPLLSAKGRSFTSVTGAIIFATALRS